MNRRLRKFLALPAPDRLLLFEAALALAAVRFALWVVPIRILLRPVRPRPATCSPHSAGRICWAVQAVAGAIPKSTCLVRAIAGRYLLARRGIPSIVRIGVARSPDFQAHAWLEHEGKPLLGGAALDGFTPLYSAVPASACSRSEIL